MHEAVVGEEDDATGAEAPRRFDVLDRLRRRQPVGADPGPHRLIARRLPNSCDLRGEDRRVRRIGHRTDDVDPAVLEPHRPVLKPARRRLGRVGIDGRAEERVRPPRFDRRAKTQHERVEPRAPEARPPLRICVGRSEQRGHTVRVETATLFRCHRRHRDPAGRPEAQAGCSRTRRRDIGCNPRARRRGHSGGRDRRRLSPGDPPRRHEPGRRTGLRRRRRRGSSARAARDIRGCARRCATARRQAAAASSAIRDAGRPDASARPAVRWPTRSG